MPEGNVNAEVAEHLRERDPEQSKRRIEVIEIAEAVLLAAVALMTALSGYQASLWHGESARDYAESSRLRSKSIEQYLESGQIAAYNADTLNLWLQARVAGDRELQRVLERRFTPEYAAAFTAWLAEEPLTDPDAPTSPRFMPASSDPLKEEATRLGDAATQAFEDGVHHRETGEKYIRITVLLATVLFLIAIGQRFRIRGVRYGVGGVGGVLLVFCLYLFVRLPHQPFF